jgi:diadenosine tetraphosphate (Ap4A) HIT family hydrolase
MKCAFCEIPEIKERTIVENELAWAFPTNIPIVPGHTLIVPKRCVASIEDVSQEELLAVFDLRTKLESAMRKAFGAEGFNYAWNQEKMAGQSVPHFHLHMLPRTTGDAGIYEYEPRKFLYRPGEREASPEAELKSVALLIAQSL